MILEHIADKLQVVSTPSLQSLHKYKETVRKSISVMNAALIQEQRARQRGVQPHDSPELAARIRGRQKAVSRAATPLFSMRGVRC